MLLIAKNIEKISILTFVPDLKGFSMADPKGQEPQGHTYNKGC